MADLKIGQSITALRMSNKAVTITGTIDALNDDGQTVVVKAVDASGQEFLETVHAADVTPVKATIEDLEKLLNSEDGTPVTVNPDGSVTRKSFTTVNGKAI